MPASPLRPQHELGLGAPFQAAEGLNTLTNAVYLSSKHVSDISHPSQDGFRHRMLSNPFCLCIKPGARGGGEASEPDLDRTRRRPGTRCPPRPRRNRLALWLVTLSARRWPVLFPRWELQSAVINETPGAACTGSHGHGGPGQRKLGAAGGYPSAAESAL